MTLNDKIVAHLTANGVAFVPGDFITGIENDLPERILHWSDHLGPIPSADDLAVAADARQRAEDLADAKSKRSEKIAAIVVTTSAGNTFDGDEKSQDRMARAIAAMDDVDTMPWVLADNSVMTVGKSELREALRLSGSKMAEIWVSVYQ